MLLDLSPLKNGNLRKLFFGQLISSFGSQMTAVIIPFQVYFLTESVFWTGLVSGVEFIFLFISSLIGGVLADRIDKRKLLIGAELVLSLLPLILAVNSTFDRPSLVPIFLIAGLSSFMNGLHRPALEALTPRLVAADDLAKVSALMPMKHILTTILSPLVGGALMLTAGAAVAFVVDALTFLISLLFLLTIRYQASVIEVSEGGGVKKFFSELEEGRRYLSSRPDILGTYVNDFIAMVFCNPVALFPALAVAFDRQESLGLLYAMPSVGALLMSGLSRWTLNIERCGLFVVVAALSWAVSMFFVGIVPSFTAILLGLFCAGYFDMMSGIFRMTIWNETIPEAVRGRMAGFEMLSYMSGPLLGNALLGLVADAYGIQASLAVGALVACLALLAFNGLCPHLWRFSRFAGERQEISI